jgi:hypothetical protein
VLTGGCNKSCQLAHVSRTSQCLSVTAQCDGLSVRTGVRVGGECVVRVGIRRNRWARGGFSCECPSVLPLKDASHLARSEVLTAVLLKVRVVWDMTPGGWLSTFRLLLPFFCCGKAILGPSNTVSHHRRSSALFSLFFGVWLRYRSVLVWGLPQLLQRIWGSVRLLLKRYGQRLKAARAWSWLPYPSRV